MITLYVGDVHGQFHMMNQNIKEAVSLSGIKPDRVVQVGDWGFFPNIEMSYKWNSHGYPISFIDGNHENHNILQSGLYKNSEQASIANFIERGILQDEVLYVGGGLSIDRAWRTEGKDWFPREELTEENIEQIHSLLDKKPKVSTMVCHDTVNQAYPYICTGKRQGLQPLYLEDIWNRAQPKLFIHGHHHNNELYRIKDTIFICLAMVYGQRTNSEESCLMVEDHKILWPEKAKLFQEAQWDQ